jgi:putative membrane protein
MRSIAILAAAIAALIHLWFFAMESLWFMRPTVWRRFGIASEADASIVRSFAYNQGFYNLFLAVGVTIGLALVATGDVASGRVLVLFACGSMIAAGLVLYLHNPRFLQAATVQAVPPLIAVAAIILPGLLSRPG